MWSLLGIRYKILVLMLTISVVPLLLINFVWLNFSQRQLQSAAADRQSALLFSAAQTINDALDSKISTVVSASQDINVTNLELELAKVKLLQFADQDSEISRIALVNNKGDEQLIIKNGKLDTNLINVADSRPFQVVKLVSNEPFISDVWLLENTPYITISVPLLSFNRLGDQDLTSSEALARRFGADIKGALIVQVNLSRIWQTLVNARLGDDGYVYLVDADGDLLVHPSQSFEVLKTNFQDVAEVSKAKKLLESFDLQSVAENYKVEPEVTASETGTEVLSSNFPIARTKWALIGQEPVASVYSSVNRIATAALIMFAISIPLAITLVLLATRTIISPIRQLTDGVTKIGSGDFTSHIAIKGKDELSLLAGTFNEMGDNVRLLLDKLQTQNLSLAAEQTKLQAILDTIADGVIVLDADFNIVLANKTSARFVDQSEPTELNGKHWLKVFSLFYEDRDFTDEHLETNQHFFHDVTMRLGDKPMFIDLTTIRVMNDPNGIAYILTLQDTTQRRELENMKLDFVSMAAHELRTPLTAISGYLTLIAGDNVSQDEQKSFVHLAGANASILDSIIDNMLSLSRIERDALVINKHRIDWKHTVTEEVEGLRFMADARNMPLSIEMPDEDIAVWGDEVALREVLGNLINNAIHYSDDGQPIVVKVEKHDDKITTTVSDKGIGIPEQLHDKLFTKYYRAKGGLTTNSQGTGIGLFISKSIIDAHDGDIGARSVFGEGSDFYFTIEAFDEAKHRQDGAADGTISSRGKVDWFNKNTDR